MSLAFQNSEAVKSALFEELQNLLSSENEVRQSAEKRMKQLEFTEGYGVYLSEWIMNQSLTLGLRQIACVMLTRYVENHWTGYDEHGNEVTAGGVASAQAKRTIRNILPNGLYDPNSKVRTYVAHTISTIATTDWPDVWVEMFDIIIKCLGGNEDSIHGAMEILRDFTYDEKQIKELGPVVISEIFRIFTSEQNYSVETRTLAISILEPLFLSISVKIVNKGEQASMMNSILTIFMEKLIHYLSMNSAAGSNFMLRTEIAKLFTFMVVETPKYIQPYLEKILPVIWQLLTQIADTYVRVTVNQTEPIPSTVVDGADEKEVTNLSNMIIQVMDFIHCVIQDNIRSSVKNVLTDLIYIVIVFIQVTVEQIEGWNEDPDKFIDDENDNAVEVTVRMGSVDVLAALYDEMGHRVVPALQEALGRHMNVAEAEKSAGNANWWKIQEACMVAVHCFREIILDAESKFDLLNYLTMVHSWLKEDECPYLVGRALWTLSTYSTSTLFNPQKLEEILVVTEQSLQPDKSLVLKICAIRAISNFVDHHGNSKNTDKRALIQAKLPNFFEAIFTFIPGCKSSFLGMILESLTSIALFDPVFAGQAQTKIIPLTIAVFLKYPEDPFILETVQELIAVLCKNPLCLSPLQDKFIPTIVSILSLQGKQASAANQDIALEVLTTIVNCSQAPLPTHMMESAFPAMIDCALRSEDQAVMIAGGECLRAFIFVSPEQVCSYKNGEGLNYTMQLTTMLLNPMNNEMTAGQIGHLVIAIIVKMGNMMLGENIDLLLKAVISKMQLVECLKVVMSLVMIFAHLFLTQMEAVLNFLSTVPGPAGEPALQFVFNNWLSRQSSFFGQYERRVTTLALCKLFEYGVTTQDSRLTSITIRDVVEEEPSSNVTRVKTRSQSQSNYQWVSVPALVKIFKLLINELYHIKEANDATCYDTETNDDEDEDPCSDDKPTSSGTLKPRFVSDLYFDHYDIDCNEDQMTQELLKGPLFQPNMEETLTKFFQQFSVNEHFPTFFGHLTQSEKNFLDKLKVAVA